MSAIGTRTRRRLVVLLLALAAALSIATPGIASASLVSLAETPLEVQLWPGGEPGHTLFIVTGRIPDGTELPATVRLPLPPGAQVVWSGEILGGPVSEDPERPGSVVDVEGGQAFEFSAETTLTVQYEAIGPPLSVAEGMTKMVFEWVQSVPVSEVSFSVRVPPGAEEVLLDPDAPGAPRTNESGERLYTLRPVLLAEGQEYTVTAAYGRAGSRDAGAGDPIVPPVLIAALAAAVVALVLALLAQRRAR